MQGHIRTPVRRGQALSQEFHDDATAHGSFELRRPTGAPAAVENLFFSEEMTATERRVLLLIEAFSTPFHDCFASNKRIAHWVGRDARTVKRCLQRLRELDLIVCWGEREDRRMRVTWVPPGAGCEQKSGRDTACPHTKQTRPEKRTLKSVPPTRDDVTEAVPMLLPPSKPSHPAKKDGVTQSPEDVRYADRLRELIVKAGCGIMGWSRSSWAKEFALLRTGLGGNSDQIDKMIEWYSRNIKKEFVPHIFCAHSFRTKWNALEAAYRRQVARDPQPAVITPRAAKIAGRLENMGGWPKGTEAQLPAAVQVSLDAVNQFLDKLEKAEPTLPPKLQKLARKVQTALMPDPGHTVEKWLESVRSRLARWKGWSGTLGMWTWRADRPEFAACGRELASAWATGPEAWDQLTEAVNAGVS